MCGQSSSVSDCRVVMAEWLGRQTSEHKIVGSSPAEATWIIKNHSAWAMGDNN